MSTPTKSKTTTAKEKGPRGAPRKERLFAGLSASENTMIILCHHYKETNKDGPINWQLIGEQGGVKASSARTTYGNGKRKLAQFLAELQEHNESKAADADIDSNTASSSSVKKGKAPVKGNDGSPLPKRIKLAQDQPMQSIEAGDSGIEDSEPIIPAGSQGSDVNFAGPALKTESEEDEFYLERKYPRAVYDDEAALYFLRKEVEEQLPSPPPLVSAAVNTAPVSRAANTVAKESPGSADIVDTDWFEVPPNFAETEIEHVSEANESVPESGPASGLWPAHDVDPLGFFKGPIPSTFDYDPFADEDEDEELFVSVKLPDSFN